MRRDKLLTLIFGWRGTDPIVVIDKQNRPIVSWFSIPGGGGVCYSAPNSAQFNGIPLSKALEEEYRGVRPQAGDHPRLFRSTTPNDQDVCRQRPRSIPRREA